MWVAVGTGVECGVLDAVGGSGGGSKVVRATDGGGTTAVRPRRIGIWDQGVGDVA